MTGRCLNPGRISVLLDLDVKNTWASMGGIVAGILFSEEIFKYATRVIEHQMDKGALI